MDIPEGDAVAQRRPADPAEDGPDARPDDGVMHQDEARDLDADSVDADPADVDEQRHDAGFAVDDDRRQ